MTQQDVAAARRVYEAEKALIIPVWRKGDECALTWGEFAVAADVYIAALEARIAALGDNSGIPF